MVVCLIQCRGYGRPEIITIICGNRSGPGWRDEIQNIDPPSLHQNIHPKLEDINFLILNVTVKKYTYFD